MYQSSAILVAILGALILGGCPSPTVKYLQDPKEDLDGHPKFKLVDSYILVARAQEDPKTGATRVDASNITTQSFSDVSATAVPKEDDANLYALIPKSSWMWLVNTNISATYQDNTRMIKQVGVSVDDNRLKAIQAVGAIGSSLMGMLAPPKPPTIKVPAVINPYESKGNWEMLPSDRNWQYKIIFNSPRDKAQDIDAVPASEFFRKYLNDGWFNSTSVVPFSSCRNIVLKIRPTAEYSAMVENPRYTEEADAEYKKRIEKLLRENSKVEGETESDYRKRLETNNPKLPGETDSNYKQRITPIIESKRLALIIKLKGENAKAKDETNEEYENRMNTMASDHEPDMTRSFPLQIADPRFVRTIRLPDKGSVSAHSICGADTKTESTQITGYQDLLGELGKQAKAVYEAQKSKDKSK